MMAPCRLFTNMFRCRWAKALYALVMQALAIKISLVCLNSSTSKASRNVLLIATRKHKVCKVKRHRRVVLMCTLLRLAKGSHTHCLFNVLNGNRNGAESRRHFWFYSISRGQTVIRLSSCPYWLSSFTGLQTAHEP